MEITIVDNLFELAESEQAQYKRLVIESEGDFYPSLLSRRTGSTMDENYSLYFKNASKLPHILLKKEGEIIAFLNIRKNYLFEGESYTYGDTMIVGKEFRKNGYSKTILEKFEEFAKINHSNYTMIATWSFHDVQIQNLVKRDYEIFFKYEVPSANRVTVCLRKRIEQTK